jgi:lipopolysaccharide/colanic/teichoic acid biosynthesis glycosyltransferase
MPTYSPTVEHSLIVARSLDDRVAYVRAKRCVDVVAASLAIVFASPLLIAAAVAIRLSSPGPALFRQERRGRHARLFVMYKFRTMVATASVPTRSDGALLKRRRDPRVTRVGAWLRRTSIDELPQLFNVIRGEMSLVGPRPLVPHMLEPYPEFHAIRALVRPGITGLWQIRDREHSTNASFMMAHDLEYIETMSVWRDLRILAATIGAVASARGSF